MTSIMEHGVELVVRYLQLILCCCILGHRKLSLTDDIAIINIIIYSFGSMFNMTCLFHLIYSEISGNSFNLFLFLLYVLFIFTALVYYKFYYYISKNRYNAFKYSNTVDTYLSLGTLCLLAKLLTHTRY